MGWLDTLNCARFSGTFSSFTAFYRRYFFAFPPMRDYFLHLYILKRAGIVLLIAGVIDLGCMIYCIRHEISYSSSLNIFAVIGGIFLMKGNLRAVSIIRWLATLVLAIVLSTLVLFPLFRPIDLALTVARLHPGITALSYCTTLIVSTLLWWLIKQLAAPPVLAAREAAGKKKRNFYIPAAIGIAMILIMAGNNFFVQQTDAAQKAISLTRQQLGNDYRYHVASLYFQSSSEGEEISGIVTAWNAQEIRRMPFQWKD